MNDHLLYLASTGIVAFTCLLVSGLLLSLKTLRESTIPKYRTACKYLASALVGIGHIFILSSGTDERTIMELFYFPILLISASQALLFTFLLTLLFRGKNVTRRNILLHAMPTIALTVAYTIACLFREDVHTYRFDVWWDNIGNPPLLIRTLTCLVYLVQLGGYTHFFFRERAIYLGNLKQIPQSPERLELRWVTRAFLWALGIGIAAVSLCFFPNNYYNTAVNFVFALFYASVSIHYANYHYTYDQLYLRLNLAPQADADTDPNRMDLEDLIGELLEIEEDELFQQAQNYMASSSPFLNPNFSRQDLVRALGTNEKYLSTSIKDKLNITLKEYIDRYRVNHARTELLMPGDSRSMEEIAVGAGFTSSRTFSRIFQKILGVTPAQYRRQAQ